MKVQSSSDIAQLYKVLQQFKTNELPLRPAADHIQGNTATNCRANLVAVLFGDGGGELKDRETPRLFEILRSMNGHMYVTQKQKEDFHNWVVVMKIMTFSVKNCNFSTSMRQHVSFRLGNIFWTHEARELFADT